MENAGFSTPLSRLCTAVILCGGRATRLQEYLRGRSKALVLLDRRPYLHCLLLRLREAGLKDVVLCVSPFSLDIVELIRGGRDYGLEVRYSFDSGMKENADALWRARAHIRTQIAICINGDTIFDIDFCKLVQAHLHGGATATLVASNRVDQPHPGALEVAPDGKIVDLHEQAQDLGVATPRLSTSKAYSNSGVYAFNMRSLEKLWLRKHRVGKIEQGLLRSLAAGKDLTAMRNGDRYLLDIGTPERLKTARLEIDSISRVFAV